MNKVLLIANPVSGKNKAEAYAHQLKEVLMRTYQATVEIKLTRQFGDARHWASQAADQMFDTVICLGGDGTVNDTVHGLIEANEKVDFGFVPMGTVNDLARAIGYSLNPAEAILQFQNVTKVGVDIAQVNDRYFINVLAIGPIPSSVMNTESKDKNLLGQIAYVKDAIGAFFSDESMDLIIENSHGKRALTSTLLFVALTNSVGGYEEMVSHASFNDGFLHLVAVKGGAPQNMIKAVLEGGVPQHESENILVLKDQSFKISMVNQSTPLKSNIDGDPGPQLPLEVKILPSKITILQPTNPSSNQN